MFFKIGNPWETRVSLEINIYVLPKNLFPANELHKIFAPDAVFINLGSLMPNPPKDGGNLTVSKETRDNFLHFHKKFLIILFISNRVSTGAERDEYI